MSAMELFDHILVVGAELADDGSFCARHAVLEKAERCVGGYILILPGGCTDDLHGFANQASQ
jgi:hypothetical protein